MPEINENQLLSGQQTSGLPAHSESSVDPTLNVPAQTGEDLLEHMEKTVADKAATDFGLINTTVFKTDDILAGKYQIIKFLSRGNTGAVYQARHIMLNKLFAIKVLSPVEPLKYTSTERFQREAHAAASLSHPNIISVHDFGVLPSDTLYLAMEYLEGETLAHLLEKEDRLDYRQALPIFIQVCLALEYAHSQGLIHRDLKPSNIMLVQDYKGDQLAKVIDFSIAKFTNQKPNQRTITKPGQIFGTPLYMSPEQCQGKKPDHRSDIYSLGCVMYETLCSVPPLMGDSLLTTIFKHVNELPIPFSQHAKNPPIPKDLEAIVFKALAKQPENRFQSAGEMRAALEMFNKNHPAGPIKIELPWSAEPSTSLAVNKILLPLLLFLIACFVIGLCLFLNAKVIH